jgi:lipopolysaccharide export system permease protein
MIFDLNIGFTDFLRLCAYLAPNLLIFSMPMAGTLGVIIAFTRLSNDNEIIALKASGLNLYRLLPPVFFFALSAALLTGFLTTKMIPAGNIALKNLFVRLATEKIDKGIREKRFSEGTGNIVLYVDKIDSQTQQWHGVYLSDLSEQDNPVTVIAKSGSLTSHMENMYISLNLEKGSMHRSDESITQTIEFNRYQLNIPIEPPKSIDGTTKNEADKSTLSQAELLEQAEKFGPQSAPGNNYLVEYHKRIVFAGGSFILCMLGLPIALRSKAGQRNYGILLGLGFFILYFVAITAAKGICDTTSLNTGLVMWTPNIVFAVITLTVTIITASEKWEDVLQALRNPFSKTKPPHTRAK